MKELGPATEEDMVLAFLQAEIDSPRFGPNYVHILQGKGLNRGSLIDQPDKWDSYDNAVRLALLRAVRGYRADQLLFQGFPEDVVWRRVFLESAEYGCVKYANYPTWTELSGGTRLVIDGAKNLEAVAAAEDAPTNINSVAAALRAGKSYPPLIAVDGPLHSLILVEGHTRATAYVLEQEPAEVIVGASPEMRQWAFY